MVNTSLSHATKGNHEKGTVVPQKECAHGISFIGMESRTNMLNSKSSHVYCISVHRNTLGRGVRLHLFFSQLWVK